MKNKKVSKLIHINKSLFNKIATAAKNNGTSVMGEIRKTLINVYENK